VATEAASAPSALAAELAPDLAGAVASLAEATLSVEPNSAPTVAEPAAAGNGHALKREAPTPPWQSNRRRLRFWWLRRLVPTSNRSVSEPLQYSDVDGGAADAKGLAAAPTTPTVGPHAQRSGDAPSRLPDAEAPWRRMLPTTRPPLLLPRPGADDVPPEDHLAV
jgi:hypothetical protein